MQMNKKRFFTGILLGLISLAGTVWLDTFDFVKGLELKTLDYRFRYRQKENADPNIAIVAIDDYAIELIGRWPWQRSSHSALLKFLAAYPPKAVGFDIMFIDPEENDVSLAHYSNLLGNVVYAGYLRDYDNELILPVEALREKSRLGLINAPPDIDGVIRRIPLVIKCGNEYFPSLTLSVLCNYLDIDYKDIKINDDESLKVPGLAKNIPIDMNGNILINFTGDQHAFMEVSFPQVLSWNESGDKQDYFKDKIVLVGLTATGSADQGNTPIGTNIPLVAVHANAINTILKEDYIYEVPVCMTMAVIILMALLSVVINIFMKPLRAAVITFLFLFVFLAVNLYLFSNSVYLEVIGPVFALMFPFVLITVYRYSREEGDKRRIKRAFTHYLSKDVIKEILDNPETLKLGGEEREATVMFVDLRNFTGFCENIPPKDVVKLLNDNFDWMTEIILSNGGMLDKYIGDAIMAIFGAPAGMPVSEQAKKAVNAGLEILKKCGEKKGACLGIGIGINSGRMVVGNMGSKHIFNYTAIGDEVNIAMRVQSLTGTYKTDFIITESVYKWVKDTIKAEFIGDVLVKGKKEPVNIWSVSIRD